MDKRLKIVIALSVISLILLTIAWGLTNRLSIDSVNAATPTNSLIKGSTPAVYYLADDGKRYVFPNSKIFFSWYPDFQSVIEISDVELATYPLGGNINYRPGTRLVKIVSVPKVYAVGPNGQLFPIPDENTAQNLYGPDWAQRVDDLSDVFFIDYTIGDEIIFDKHPEGTVFKYDGTPNYFLLERTGDTVFARELLPNQFANFRYQDQFVLTLENRFTFNSGPVVESNESHLQSPNQPPASTEPITDTATIDIKIQNHIKNDTKIVAEDNNSKVLGIDIVGDEFHPVTINSFDIEAFIDANGNDTDFVKGTDVDELIVKQTNLLFNGLDLYDETSQKTLTSRKTFSGAGDITLSPNLTIQPGETISVAFRTRASAGVSLGTRLSIDFDTANINVSSSTANQINFMSPGRINGSINPGRYVTVQEFGKLTIHTENLLGNSIEDLRDTITPMKIVFTAEGESYEIDQFSMEATNLGGDVGAIESLYIIKPNGEKIFSSELEIGKYTFDAIGTIAPKDGSVEFILEYTVDQNEELWSDSRLQFDFIIDLFNVIGQAGNTETGPGLFADKDRLDDQTAEGPLITHRLGTLQLSPHFDSPVGVVKRFKNNRVMTFTITAGAVDIEVRKLTFKIETSDIDEDGDDNDMLERFADLSPSVASDLYLYDADIEDRNELIPSSVQFGIFVDGQGLDLTPEGIQTSNNDYGLLIYNYGSNPLKISAGQSKSYDLDIDTTTITSDDDQDFSLKIILLGDEQSTPSEQANFKWDDGSGIDSSGYLIPGLDLSSHSLSVS